MKQKAVIIVSGGLDSITLLYHVYNLGYECSVLSFNYGQRHSKELEYAKYHCEKLNITHKIVDISFFNSLVQSSSLTNSIIDVPDIKDVLGHPQPNTYVPARNMMFLSIALSYAESIGALKVFYGAQMHDAYGYWDTTIDFVERINHLVELNRLNQLTVEAPLVNNKKSDNIKLGLTYNIDFSKTWSCYNGREKACGTCPTCAERIKGFKDLGLTDPLEYEV